MGSAKRALRKTEASAKTSRLEEQPLPPVGAAHPFEQAAQRARGGGADRDQVGIERDADPLALPPRDPALDRQQLELARDAERQLDPAPRLPLGKRAREADAAERQVLEHDRVAQAVEEGRDRSAPE